MAAKKSTRRVPLRVVAIHEAGHAVASYYLHVTIKAVTIIPAEDSLGKLTHHRVSFGRHGLFDDSVRGIDRAERHIMVCWAGQIAQRKCVPRSRWRVDGCADNEIAMELFTHIMSPDQKARDLQVALLWRQTEVLVEHHWKEIVAVADALLEHKALDAEGVDAAICRALGLEPLRFEPVAAREAG
jgi:hypothetical protein